MKIPCEIENVKTLKKGMKITLTIEDENVKEVLKNIYNYHDRSLIVDINIDSTEEKQKLNQINADQRKKIFAIIKDISDSTGANKEYTREELTKQFTQQKQIELFSLSNCDKETASDFIAWLIEFAFEYGVELKEHPKEALNDIKRYIEICNRRDICAICGRDGQVRRIKNSNIALCDKHNSEAGKGWKEFLQKYHLVGDNNQQNA